MMVRTSLASYLLVKKQILIRMHPIYKKKIHMYIKQSIDVI